VALGRIPLISELLREGKLVAPFPKRYDSPRGYFVVRAPHAADRPDVGAFAAWLQSEAAAQLHDDAAPDSPLRRDSSVMRQRRKERP